MRLTTILLLTTMYGSLCAQSPIKELKPEFVSPLDLSAQGEKEFNDNMIKFNLIMDKMSKGIEQSALSADEKEILSKMDETVEDYWEIPGAGCSWYCGGGPENITASSALKTQGENSY